MIEVYGNYWDVEADVRVITTNLDVNHEGLAVMGRGVARQAANRWPWLRRVYGDTLADMRDSGLNFFHDGTQDSCEIVTLPVKHHWNERADIALIAQNIARLGREYRSSTKRVVLVRPGCGNGGLDWEGDRIKDLCEILLPGDNFIIVENRENPEDERVATLVLVEEGQ